MKTVTEVELPTPEGPVVAEIKSKRDNSVASGWSVIAFLPSCSIRSIKCHRPDNLTLFAEAIVAASGAEWSGELAEEVEGQILSIID